MQNGFLCVTGALHARLIANNSCELGLSKILQMLSAYYSGGCGIGQGKATGSGSSRHFLSNDDRG